MDAHIQYTNELHRKFGYLATWAPNVSVRLGDVGVLANHVFSLSTTLGRLGIRFEVRESSAEANYQYASSNTVSITQKLAGQAPTAGSVLSAAEAGISINFGAENAVVFYASQCRESTIEGIDELGKEIIARNQNGQWPSNHVVVTSVVAANAATILISSGSEAQLELVTEAAAGAGGLSLAKLESNFRIAREHSLGTKIVAGPR